MKPIFNILSAGLIALFISVEVSAQSKEKVQAKCGLLWEVSGKGMKAPSYLFGTYHLIGKNFLDTLPAIMRHFSKAQTVVGEVVMEDEMAMAQKLMPMMLLKDNSLDKILSDREFAEIDSFLKVKTSMNLSMLNGMKPAAVQIMLVAMLAPKNISPENPALDMFFQTEAKKAGKNVVGFETAEQQGALLFNQSLSRQKDLLLKTVRENARMMRESQELFHYYKNQDLEAIEKAFSSNEDYTPEEMDAMLAQRNKVWIKVMPEMMNKSSVFFAVGAGHLVGREGLINSLRELGYTLKPVF
ncbi:TraB/GumN family protein [Paradesertivirga mongoliensis]|uniref:TraB/GumN family protein n=1 Tax=Paradesertivirga mongoliensis TaxID=2100740 RepID=A0ABW4ZFZ0_9SPHI|nr:TraB/GumN family protein [Pedobacter mongoliensis]